MSVDSEYLAPNWNSGPRCHNWRNHVGERAKTLWDTFTPEQKIALGLDADDQASAEEWE